MHIILGATGHIGSELARLLLDRGEPVTVVVRNRDTAAAWRARGARSAVADIHDTGALREALLEGTRLFLLNPPADPAFDSDVEERVTLRSILTALEGSSIRGIVAASTYGAKQGTRIGDLGTLHELEQGLAAQAIPVTVLRSAYYMSNWDKALTGAREQGMVPSFFPVEFELPMVAPRDIAEVAAELLTEPNMRTGLVHVEGPERCSAARVAAAFARELAKPIHAVEIPPDRWLPTLEKLRFSAAAAESFAGMCRETLGGRFPDASQARRGATSIEAYIAELVGRP